MLIVNVYQAKTQLSRLLAQVEAGAEIVIARRGNPIARLVPDAGKPARRRLGYDDGAYEVGDLFAPLGDDELAAWYRSPLDPRSP